MGAEASAQKEGQKEQEGAEEESAAPAGAEPAAPQPAAPAPPSPAAVPPAAAAAPAEAPGPAAVSAVSSPPPSAAAAISSSAAGPASSSSAPPVAAAAAAPPAQAEAAEEKEDEEALDKELALLGVSRSKEASKKAIEAMIALKPTDDERTVISKKVSWILRHGAKKAGIDIDGEGWVKLQDLMSWELLANVPSERLESIIMESNEQKSRYEFRDAEDGKYIRAVNKSARGREPKDRSDRERRGRRDGDGMMPPQKGDWQDGGGGGGDRGAGGYDGPRGYDGRRGPITYQEQLDAGYRPILEGGRAVAMVKDGISERPGKGAPKGEGKGSEAYASYSSQYRQHEGDGYKGDGGKGDGKGYRSRDGYGRRDREDRGYPPRNAGQFDGDGGMGRDRDDDAYGDSRQEYRQKWRVVAGQDVIVRESVEVESAKVGELQPSSLVLQIGEEVVLKNGIVRIQVQAIEPGGGLCGWVTRTAEAAGGPIFFKQERGGAGRGGRGRGGGGGHRDMGNRNYGKGGDRGRRNWDNRPPGHIHDGA
mmetsp:Transcript_73143/g.174299  ORF Transcript_73143/g.174299 Transcript_73143/m.174299 type:complete len:535 (+) Transcript_73143:81-1685(+)